MLACSNPSSFAATPEVRATSSNFPAAVATVEVVCLAIVGHEEIELSVIVEIRPECGKAITALGIVDSGFLGDIGERSVSIIVVKIVGKALQAARSALHVEPKIFARFARAEYGQVVQMEIHVMRHE